MNSEDSGVEFGLASHMQKKRGDRIVDRVLSEGKVPRRHAATGYLLMTVKSGASGSDLSRRVS